MTDEERRRIRAALDLCEPLRLEPWQEEFIYTPIACAREVLALEQEPRQEPVVRRVGSQVSSHRK